ncbi:MAG TPA: ROK family protein [Anaerolineales bacterium]|jgi:fructokinase|nr:ROK family protein [Anaerolineales bacterium]
MQNKRLFGGIEAGGTKFVCLIAGGPNHIVDEIRLNTTMPEETLGRAIQFFKPFVSSGQIHAIGVGCFGPLDLNPSSPTYGYITATPKAGWSNTNVFGILRGALGIEIVMDTDVNAAGLGEYKWGASNGYDPSLYLTIGTGIGGGYIQDGGSLIGLVSPEMGHIRIPHNRELDPFVGNCPFHEDCFEGLASGPAIEKRLGKPGAMIPENDPFWNLEAEYIASALMNYILTLSPKKIVLGGGVMQRGFLFSKIRWRVRELLNGYVSSKSLLEHIEDYIVPPGLGNQSGSLGAIALAMQLDEDIGDPRL